MSSGLYLYLKVHPLQGGGELYTAISTDGLLDTILCYLPPMKIIKLGSCTDGAMVPVVTKTLNLMPKL